MSLYAEVDDEDFGQVATIKGWSDLIDWADSLDYPELAHLAEHGFSEKLSTLADEIGAAITESNPRPDIETTARGIEEICRANPDAKILVVTDGTDDDFDEEDDEDDDEFDDED